MTNTTLIEAFWLSSSSRRVALAVIVGLLVAFLSTASYGANPAAGAVDECSGSDPPPECWGEGEPTDVLVDECSGSNPPPECSGGGEEEPTDSPPTNDNWANASNLGSLSVLDQQPVTGGGSTKSATMQSGEPSPKSPSGADCGWLGISNTVWYKITPSEDGDLKVSSEGSLFDTVLALYEGAALKDLKQVGCSNANDAPNWTDTMKAPVKAGQTYYLQLSGTGGARSGDYKIKASLEGGDNFENASGFSVELLHEVIIRSGSTKSATMQSDEPSPSAPDRDCGRNGISNTVWYKVTPSQDGELTVSSEGSSFDTVLALYEGTALNQLKQVGCSNANDAPNWTDTMKAPVKAGQTYYLQLSGTGGARSGDYKIKALLDCNKEQCLKVATFNINQGEIKETYPDPWDQKQALQRMGRQLLSLADVVLLQEAVKERPWWEPDPVSTMAESAGLPYWYKVSYTDSAIVSRYPLTQTTWHVTPRSALWYGGFFERNKFLEAMVNIDGVPHRFLGAHWYPEHLDEAGTYGVESAEKVRDLLKDETKPAFFGGDLNASTSTKQVGILTREGNPPVLKDSYPEVPGAYHCSDKRIDYVFYRGPYKPVAYGNCFEGGFPSDHPFVIVAFERTSD